MARTKKSNVLDAAARFERKVPIPVGDFILHAMILTTDMQKRTLCGIVEGLDGVRVIFAEGGAEVCKECATAAFKADHLVHRDGFGMMANGRFSEKHGHPAVGMLVRR